MTEISADTTFTLLTKARDVADQRVVRKAKGTSQYVFRRNLLVYKDVKGETPLKIEGYFLVSSNGAINQISDPDTLLSVEWSAEELYDTLQEIFDRDPDDDK